MWRTFAVCVLLATAGNSVAQTFACQYVSATGLNWENGSWQTRRFKIDAPFFLALNANSQGLTFDSVAKLLGAAHTCITDGSKVVTCMGVEQGYFSNGSFLLFDPTAMQGGRSSLLGSTEKTDVSKDSIVVAPFVCQKVK